MTVRVNKSSFNIREKLSELERPIGLKGSELMRSETAQEAGALLGVGRKNTIINGDFRIAQRSTDTGTISLTTADTYRTVDRWRDYSYNYSGTFTPQYRVRQYEDHPISGNQGYCLRYDCVAADTPATNVDFLITNQIIEADNTINFYNNYLSLSFWVKSNKTGSYSVQFRASGSVSGTTPNLLLKYNINAADTWEYKTLLIPPQNLSLITNGNGSGYNLFFTLASGQNKNYDASISNVENKWGLYSSSGLAFTDQTNLMSTAGNYWQVTNVQLEVGKNATEFEHRSYGEELALCQRYYYRHAYGAWDVNHAVASGMWYQTTSTYFAIHFPVEMRTAASLEYSNNGSTTAFVVFNQASSSTTGDITTQEQGRTCYIINIYNLSPSRTAGYGAWAQINNSGAHISFSAEL